MSLYAKVPGWETLLHPGSRWGLRCDESDSSLVIRGTCCCHCAGSCLWWWPDQMFWFLKKLRTIKLLCKALAAPSFRNSPSLCGCGVMGVESKSRNSVWPLPQASWIKRSWLLDKRRPRPYRSQLILYTQIVPLWHKACRSLLEDAPRREVGVKQAGGMTNRQ